MKKNYAKNFKSNVEKNLESDSTVVEMVIDEVEEVEGTSDNNNVDTVDTTNNKNTIKTKMAKLSGCTALYLRDDMSKDSEYLTIITPNDTIRVLEQNNNTGFTKAEVVNKKLIGYCVSEYLEICN